MDELIINESQVEKLITLLKLSIVPRELESSSHSFAWTKDLKELANAYFAIVAICHQTSPIGERALHGYIDDEEKSGWDYLKEKFLIAALKDSKWCSPQFWKSLTPSELSALYFDSRLSNESVDKSAGMTLGRLNERAYLINDLGRQLSDLKIEYIFEAFLRCEQRIGGESGFMGFLQKFEAYKDPVYKKSLFFLSIVANECKWIIQDGSYLLSPVDYHELRGHLRIGTIKLLGGRLSDKNTK